MLKKEDATKIALLLKIKETDLMAAITATEETAITIPEIQVFTTDELTARDNNKYGEGKTAGAEMQIKDLKAKHGIELDSKDPDKFIDAITAKVLKDANLKPDAKVLEMNGIITTLRSNLEKSESEKQALEGKVNGVNLERTLIGKLPKNINPILGTDTVLNELRGNLEFLIEDGKEVTKRGGVILRDPKTQDAISWDKAANDFLTEKKWLVEEASGAGQKRPGRGEGSDKGSNGIYLKQSEFKADYTAKNGKDSTMGEEYSNAVMAAREANPGFKMEE